MTTNQNFSRENRRESHLESPKYFIRLTPQELIEMKESVLNLVSAALIQKPGASVTDPTLVRISEVVSQIAFYDPEFVLKLAVYVRLDLNIRSTANYLFALASNIDECRPFVRKYFCDGIRLPSDWIDVASTYRVLPEKKLKGKSVPSCLRKAMVDKFPQFDTYQLGKYNNEKSVKRKLQKEREEREQHPERDYSSRKPLITIKQMVRDLHLSEPTFPVMCILGKKYPANEREFRESGLSGNFEPERAGTRMKLPTPETWETLLSEKGNKASTWEELIEHKKLPFMAMLRNIRNLIYTGVHPKYHRWVQNKLSNQQTIANSRQFPFSFFSAYEVIPRDLEHFKELTSGTSTTGMRRKNRKPIVLAHMPPPNVFSDYRNALDSAVKLATVYNCEPIRGSVAVLCNVSDSSKEDAPGARNMGSSIRNVAEIGYLLGLMAKYVCEDCDFRVYSSPSELYPNTCHLPVDLIDGTILDNMRLVAEVAEKLGGGDQFPFDYIEDMIRDKHRINSLLVLSHTVIDVGNGSESRLANLLKKYRQEVNPDLLFVSVDLSGSGRTTLGSDESHPNDIMITGFSDQILRFIAERGDETQLQYVEHIDIAKKIGIDEVKQEAHISPWWKWLGTLGQAELTFPNITRSHPMRTLRLFISSTFLDMHGERDYLTRVVIPELRFKAKQRQVDVVEVDLRWGITEEDTQHGNTLAVCLNQVDKCMPFFIGILGDRYGWAPESYEVPDHPLFNWVREYPTGRSITELEIHRAVLSQPEAATGSFFYFRNNSFASDLPEDLNASFVGDEESRVKMNQLKDRIRQTGRPIYEDYPCTFGGINDDKPMTSSLEQFGERVFNDVWGALQEHYPELDPLDDELLEERSFHQSFATQLSEKFFGRKEEMKQLGYFLKGQNDNLLILKGEAGEGKSSLLSKYAIEAADADPHTFFLTHFVGASPGSIDIRNTLERLCQELHAAFDIQDEIPQDYKELCLAFPNFLEQAAFQGKLVVIIDGIDQLDASKNRSHSMEWLPRKLPCKMIISCTPGDCIDAIDARHQPYKELKFTMLSVPDRKNIVRGLLMRYHKKLDERPMNTQMRVLLRKTDSNNPLYLTLACEELRLFGVFEMVSNRIKMMKPRLGALFVEIILRLEQDYGPELIKSTLSLIACSRNGISEVELQEILDIDDRTWLTVIRGLSSYLIVSEETGEMKFFHRYFYEAIEKRYFTRLHQDTIHAKLANYYYNLIDPEHNLTWSRGGDDYRAVRELPYHLVQGKQWKLLSAVLTNIYFIELKITLGYSYELINDYAIATSADVDDYDNKESVRKYREFVRSNRHILSEYPELAFQQAMNLPDHSSPSQDAKAHWQSGAESRSFIEWINKTTKSDPCKVTLAGFADGVTCSRYSPDGEYFALAFRDCSIKIFEAVTGNELASMNRHSSWITDLKFSPDGSQLASVSWDKTTNLWDVRSTALICTFTEHKRRINACAFSNDGNFLATAAWDCTVKLWDTRGTNTRSLRSVLCGERPINEISFAPDDSHIIAASWDGSVVFIDISEYDKYHLTNVPGHAKSIQTIEYSPSGKHFVTGSLDKTVMLWDAHARKPITTLSKHSKPVTSVTYSADGELLSSASIDGTVKVWDANLGAEVNSFSAEDSKMLCCAFSPTNTSVLATGSHDCEIYIWNHQTGVLLTTLKAHTRAITCIEFSPCGTYLASSSEDGLVIIWDGQGNNTSPIHILKHHQGAVHSLSWSPKIGDLRLASASSDKNIIVVQVETGDSQIIAGHDNEVISVAFDSKGKLLVSASKDRTLRVWDSRNGNELKLFRGHKDWINGCHFYGNKVLSCSWDNTVRLWNVKTGSFTQMEGHSSAVNYCRFNPDGNTFVSCSFDGTLKIWDAQSSTEITTLLGHKEGVNYCCYNVDGSKIASVSDDCIKIWSPLASTEIETLIGHSSAVRNADFGPLNEIITSSDDRSARIWEISLPNQEEDLGFFSPDKIDISPEKQGLSGHSAKINDCRFNEEGTVLITASDDGTCRVWDLNLMKMIHIYTDPKERPYVGCDIRGDTISMVTDTSYVTLWSLQSSAQLHRENAFTKPATCLRLNNEGSAIVGGWSQEVKSISHTSYTTSYPHYHQDWITALATSNTGLTASAGWDQTCYIYNTNRNHIGTLTGHLNTITSCAISENGLMIATASIDQTVIISDLRTYSPIKTLLHDSQVNCVTFGTKESSRYIFTGSQDGYIRMWDTNGNEYNKFICAAPVTAIHARSCHGQTIIIAGDKIGNLYYTKITTQ